MSEYSKLEEAYEIYSKLKPIFGKNLKLEIYCFNNDETIEIRTYDVTNLVQFKKLTGCTKLLKNSCTDFQYAKGEVNDIILYAYTAIGSTFNPKCKIIREPYYVPATKGHTEYKTRIVCDQ